MKQSIYLAATALTGVAFAASVAGPVYATNPKGEITKSVQNVTAGGTVQAADTHETAVSAKPGDVLKYVITVKNNASGENALVATNVTDNLPVGVELVSDASVKKIEEDFGTIQAGQTVTKEYQVKVVETKDGKRINNKACFHGTTEHKNTELQGCNEAYVLVTVPNDAKTPATTQEDEKKKETESKKNETAEAAKEKKAEVTATTQAANGKADDSAAATQPTADVTALPEAGIGGILMPIAAVFATIGGFVANTLRLKRSIKG